MQTFRMRTYNDGLFIILMLLAILLPTMIVERVSYFAPLEAHRTLVFIIPIIAVVVVYYYFTGDTIDVTLKEKSVIAKWYTSAFATKKYIEIPFENVSYFASSIYTRNPFDTFTIKTKDNKRYSITCFRFFFAPKEFSVFVKSFKENFYKLYPEKKV